MSHVSKKHTRLKILAMDDILKQMNQERTASVDAAGQEGVL